MAVTLNAALNIAIRQVGLQNLNKVQVSLNATTGAVNRLAVAMRGAQRAGASGGPLGQIGKGFSNFLTLGAKVTAVGFGITHGVRMIGDAFEGAFKPVIDFTSAMAQVKIRGSFSAAETKRLSDAAMQMGRTSIFTPVEGAKAQEALAASGLGVDQIIKNMPTVKKFAIAADLDTNEASNALVNTARQFGMDLNDSGSMERVANSMIKAANISTISVRDMLQTMKYAGPIANQAGYSIEDASAWTAMVGNSGIKASQAGTGLRNMMASFAKPKGGKATEALLKQIGLSKEDVQGGLENIPAFLEQMEEKMVKKGFKRQQRLALAASLFGQYGMTAAVVLQKAAGTKATELMNGIQQYAELIRGASGEMEAAYQTRMDTPAAKLEALNARLQTLQITMGEQLLPHVTRGLDLMIAKLTEWELRARVDPEFKGAIEGIGLAIDLMTKSLSLALPALERMVGLMNNLVEIKKFLTGEDPSAEQQGRFGDAANIPVFNSRSGPQVGTAGTLGSGLPLGDKSWFDLNVPTAPPKLGQTELDKLWGQAQPGFNPLSVAPMSNAPSVVEVKVSAGEGSEAKITRIKKGRVPVRANQTAAP